MIEVDKVDNINHNLRFLYCFFQENENKIQINEKRENNYQEKVDETEIEYRGLFILYYNPIYNETRQACLSV
jgi:hypothetical protein